MAVPKTDGDVSSVPIIRSDSQRAEHRLISVPPPPPPQPLRENLNRVFMPPPPPSAVHTKVPSPGQTMMGGSHPPLKYNPFGGRSKHPSSTLGSEGAVFDVTRAFGKGEESGVIVTDKKSKHMPLRQVLAVAFKERIEDLKQGLKNVGLFDEEEVVVSIPEARKEVIMAASTPSKFAPRDDSALALKKLRDQRVLRDPIDVKPIIIRRKPRASVTSPGIERLEPLEIKPLAGPLGHFTTPPSPLPSPLKKIEAAPIRAASVIPSRSQNEDKKVVGKKLDQMLPETKGTSEQFIPTQPPQRALIPKAVVAKSHTLDSAPSLPPITLPTKQVLITPTSPDASSPTKLSTEIRSVQVVKRRRAPTASEWSHFVDSKETGNTMSESARGPIVPRPRAVEQSVRAVTLPPPQPNIAPAPAQVALQEVEEKEIVTEPPSKSFANFPQPEQVSSAPIPVAVEAVAEILPEEPPKVPALFEEQHDEEQSMTGSLATESLLVTPEKEPGLPPYPNQSAPSLPKVPATIYPWEKQPPVQAILIPASAVSHSRYIDPERLKYYSLLAISIVLLCGALVLFLILSKSRESITEEVTTAPSLVQSDARIPVPLLTDKQAFLDAVRVAGNSGSGLTHVYPTIVREIGANPTPAKTNEIMALIKPRAGEAFLRSLREEMALGYIGNSRAPFIILRAPIFDTAFAGMLQLEGAIATDFAPFFGEIETNSAFTDAVNNNKSIRVLYDRNGNEQLMYAFVNHDLVVITTTTEALSAIISKLPQGSSL